MNEEKDIAMIQDWIHHLKQIERYFFNSNPRSSTNSVVFDLVNCAHKMLLGSIDDDHATS